MNETFRRFSLFLQTAYSQDFSSLDSDLELLENLIADTLLNTEEQQKLLEDCYLPASGSLEFHTNLRRYKTVSSSKRYETPACNCKKGVLADFYSDWKAGVPR